jgi:hypothetical protein
MLAVQVHVKRVILSTKTPNDRADYLRQTYASVLRTHGFADPCGEDYR